MKSHFKDELQEYLQRQCILQQTVRDIINRTLTNTKQCNVLSINIVKFKKFHKQI
jgi:hypothetical protein